MIIRKIIAISFLLLLGAIPATATAADTPKTVAADTPSATPAGTTFVIPAGWSVETRGKLQQDKPKEQPRDLPLEKINRIVKPVARYDAAGAENHYQPDQRQDHGHDQHRPIGAGTAGGAVSAEGPRERQCSGFVAFA